MAYYFVVSIGQILKSEWDLSYMELIYRHVSLENHKRNNKAFKIIFYIIHIKYLLYITDYHLCHISPKNALWHEYQQHGITTKI